MLFVQDKLSLCQSDQSSFMSFKCIYCQTQNWETLVQRSRWLSHCVESQREWHAKSSVTKGVMGKMLARLHMAGEGAFEIWFMFLVVIWLRGALGFHSAGWSCSTHTVHSPFIYLLHLNVLPLSTVPVPVKGIIHAQMEILSLITLILLQNQKTFDYLQNTNQDIFDEIWEFSDLHWQWGWEDFPICSVHRHTIWTIRCT